MYSTLAQSAVYDYIVEFEKIKGFCHNYVLSSIARDLNNTLADITTDLNTDLSIIERRLG